MTIFIIEIPLPGRSAFILKGVPHDLCLDTHMEMAAVKPQSGMILTWFDTLV